MPPVTGSRAFPERILGARSPGAPGHGEPSAEALSNPHTRQCPRPRETSGPGAVLVETAMPSGPGEGRGRPVISSERIFVSSGARGGQGTPTATRRRRTDPVA